MLIAEKCVLLQLDEHKNRISWLGYIYNQESLGKALACSFVMDLFLKKKIEFEDEVPQKKKWNVIIKVIDESPSGDPLLDKMFTKIKNYKKKRKFYKIIRRLAYLKSKRNCMALFNTVFERLDQKGIIRLEKRMKGFPGTFHSGRQVLLKPEVKRNILKEIEEVVFENKEPDDSTIFLLTILKARNDLFIFSKELRKMAKERISEIVKQSIFSRAMEFITRSAHIEAAYGV